jgi:hypothetical protein
MFHSCRFESVPRDFGFVPFFPVGRIPVAWARQEQQSVPYFFTG